MKKTFVPVLAAGAVVAMAAVGSFAQHSEMEAGEVTKAIAIMHPTQGHNVHGQVTFTKVSGGVQVVAHLTGLPPGKHGFHIHEFGDCSDMVAAKTAGGHFNPKGKPHGAPGKARHVGDLGNIEADASGVANYDKIDSQLMFHGESSILGRGVIVHEKADDFSQPVGNAGGRLACGVIGVANVPKKEMPKK
jgi:superoxide dismutase, Cu-Zn family